MIASEREVNYARRKRTNLIVVVICLCSVVIWHVARRDGIERLPQFDNVLAVHNGYVFVDYNPETRFPGVYLQPVSGGSRVTLFNWGPSRPDTPLRSVSISQGKVSCVEHPMAPPRLPVASVIVGGIPFPASQPNTLPASNPRKQLGSFAPASDPGVYPANVTRTKASRSSQTAGGSARNVVYICDEQGSTPPQKLEVFGSSVVTVEEAVFWLNIKPDETLSLSDSSSTWTEIRGCSELWMMSTSSRIKRLIRADLPSTAELKPGKLGVFWSQQSPYPDQGLTLGYCTIADLKCYYLPDFTPVQWAATVDSTVMDYPGGVLWRVPWTSLPLSKLDAPVDRLVLVNLDGSNRRTIYLKDASTERRPTDDPAGDGLYIGMPSPDKGVSATVICKVMPKHANPLLRITELPGGCEFIGVDGGYAYFRLIETKYSTRWSELLNESADSHPVSIFCRKRI